MRLKMSSQPHAMPVDDVAAELQFDQEKGIDRLRAEWTNRGPNRLEEGIDPMAGTLVTE